MSGLTDMQKFMCLGMFFVCVGVLVGLPVATVIGILMVYRGEWEMLIPLVLLWAAVVWLIWDIKRDWK